MFDICMSACFLSTIQLGTVPKGKLGNLEPKRQQGESVHEHACAYARARSRMHIPTCTHALI